MTKDQLYTELNYVNASREKRSYYANLVIENPELIKPLLEIVFQIDDKISVKAAWIFEFVCSKSIDYCIPYLDFFTQNISKVHLDSSVRPIAKICEMLTNAYYNKEYSKVKHFLTLNHRELIVEACFDWMIKDEKVAVKVYSMTSLYLLGKEFDWIYPELKTILERDFNRQSAAFKARARPILKKI